MKKLLTSAGGFAAGILNGLLGAGGGMIVVPMLKKSGLSAQKSHATSISVILPICILSAGIYLFRGDVTFGDALPYIPWMLVGSILGALIMPHIKTVILRRIFGIMMLWAAWRMLFS